MRPTLLFRSLAKRQWIATQSRTIPANMVMMKYSTEQKPPMVTPLLNQFEQNTSTNNTIKNLMMGMLICLTGLGIGFFGTGKAIFDYFGPNEEEQNSEKNTSDSDNPLNNITAKFNEFADKEIDGVKYMSPEAFFNSLVVKKPQLPPWAAYPRDKEGNLIVHSKSKTSQDSFMLMFDLADADSDGLISESEYYLFVTLLAGSREQLFAAFELFDSDGNGKVTFDEFKSIIQANQKDPNMKMDMESNGLVQYFFGKNKKKELSFEEFSSFVNTLKEEILKQEFRSYDIENKGLISVEAFSQLVGNSVHFNGFNASSFKRGLNLLKTRGYFKPSGRIDFETFKGFHQMAQNADKIAFCIQLYTTAGKPLTKEAFSRALSKAASIKVSDKTVELVFALYDKNGDGQLDYSEFLKALAQRQDATMVEE